MNKREAYTPLLSFVIICVIVSIIVTGVSISVVYINFTFISSSIMSLFMEYHLKCHTADICWVPIIEIGQKYVTRCISLYMIHIFSRYSHK